MSLNLAVRALDLLDLRDPRVLPVPRVTRGRRELRV